MEALADFEDEYLDVVYIDALNSFNPVMLDLICWQRKVRLGGIVSGHDYQQHYHMGVMKAVDAFMAGNGISPWYLTRLDREPSWLYIKHNRCFDEIGLMHIESIRLMTAFRDRYLKDMKGCSTLDVGSREVNKNVKQNYRDILTEYQYTGMDIVSGENVDIVGYENIRQVYDVVISGQTMEHVEYPWLFLSNLKRYFTKYICIIAPFRGSEHRHPIDCYRFS